MWDDVNVSVRIRANPLKQLIAKCRHKEFVSVTDKPILRGVSGSVCPGDLLAILGSSGAGLYPHVPSKHPLDPSCPTRQDNIPELPNSQIPECQELQDVRSDLHQR